MRSVPLDGLTVDAAGELLAHVVGEPRGAQRGVRAVGPHPRRARGARPARRQREHAPRRPSSSPSALNEGPPPFAVDTPQDRRLLGLLARGARRRAVRGAARGRVRRARRRRAAAPVGRLRAGDGVRHRHLPLRGRRARPDRVGPAAAPCGAGCGRSRRGRGATRTPCSSRVASAEPVRVLQEVARQRQAWRAVLASGRCSTSPTPPRAAGTPGTPACRPCWRPRARSATRPRRPWRCTSSAPARSAAATWRRPTTCSRGALELRVAPGQHRGRRGHPAEPGDDHRPTAPPGAASRVALGRIPTPVKAVAVLLPLLGSLAFVGLAQAGATAAARLDPQRLAFVDQVVDKASAPQVFRLANDGPAALHVDNVAVGGAEPRRVHARRHELRRRGARRRWVHRDGRVHARDARRAAGQPVLADPGDPGRPHRAARRHGRGSTAAAAVPVAVDPSVLAFDAQVQGTPSAPQQRPRRRGLHAAARSRRPPRRATSGSTATAARAPCSRPARMPRWPSGSRRAPRASAPRSSPWPTPTAVRRPAWRCAAPAPCRSSPTSRSHRRRSASATRPSAPHRRRRRVTLTNRGSAPMRPWCARRSPAPRLRRHRQLSRPCSARGRRARRPSPSRRRVRGRAARSSGRARCRSGCPRRRVAPAPAARRSSAALVSSSWVDRRLRRPAAPAGAAPVRVAGARSHGRGR